METVRVEYIGTLRTKAKHNQSGDEFITDAPIDNQGKGEAFSPTDLLATSLGTCAITTIGIVANSSGFNIDGTIVKITKIMVSDPRRVGEIIVEMNFPPNNYSTKEKEIIKRTAEHCPVKKSLHPDVKQTFIFNF
jgi:putative redox protein